MVQDALDMRFREQRRMGHRHFMNQQVGILAIADHVFIIPRIAGHDRYTASIFDPVAISGLDGITVVHREGDDA